MEQNEIYQEIVEISNEAIFLEQDSLLVFANRKTLELFELESTDIGQISWRDFLSADRSGNIADSASNDISGSDYQKIQIRAKSGQYKWIELRHMPLRWEEKSAILFFARDITQQKSLEKRLQIAQKMEAIGTLAGGIAHDFNNILSPILGYTELTMDEIDQQSLAYANLSQVYKATKRAKDLVQQILAFSRQTEVASKPVKIHLIVMEALKLLRASIPSNIEFKLNIDENCPPVMADPTQIHQIVLNLCSNAYHAMQNMSGILNIKVQESILTNDQITQFITIPAGTYVQIEVSDTGQGMKPSVMERIFEPFFTTKEKGQGTGMGLSVVHGIVREHDGYINVQSDPGRGTHFQIYLPVIKTDSFQAGTRFYGEHPWGIRTYIFGRR